MADIEERVTALEHDVSALKARVVGHEEDLGNIPELIRTEFRLTNSQIARLSRDVAILRDVPAKLDALQRVMAEMLAERDSKG